MTMAMFSLNTGQINKKALMNNKIIITITTVSLYVSSHTICMEQELEQYRDKCTTIRARNELKLQRYKNELITKNTEDLEQEKIIIKNKFARYKNNLLQQKQTLLDEIKEHHNIDKNLWRICMSTIRRIDRYNKQLQHTPLDHAYHGSAIDKNIVQFMTERLKKNGINPLRVTIRNEHNQLGYIYHSKIQTPHIYKSPRSLENRTPIELIFNWNIFSQLSASHQIAVTVRLVEDAVQNSSIITPALIAEIEPLATNEENSIIDSPEFIALQKICSETLPTFLPCLINPIIASCMLDLLSENYRQDFNLKDYKLLSKINRHWNVLRWIEQLEKISYTLRAIL